MPYIKQETRPQYDVTLNKLCDIKTKGDLEYCVFKLMKRFMKTRENRFDPLHDCVKGVEHAAHEYERNYLDKREDEAKKENGDIE